MINECKFIDSIFSNIKGKIPINEISKLIDKFI